MRRKRVWTSRIGRVFCLLLQFVHFGCCTLHNGVSNKIIVVSVFHDLKLYVKVVQMVGRADFIVLLRLILDPYAAVIWSSLNSYPDLFLQ